MNDRGKTPPFRRVIVAFDPSPQGQSLLEFAADIAESLGTPLSGLFIEDEALISYAGSPLAVEVTVGSARLREIGSERMRTHFRVQQRLARQVLESLGARRSIECSFQIGRGRFAGAISAVVEQSDLLLVSPRLGPRFDPRRYAAAESPREGRRSLTVLFGPAGPRRAPRRGRVQVVLAGGAEPEATLAVATALAAREGADLAVAVLDGGEGAKAAQASRSLLDEGAPMDSVATVEAGALVERLRRHPPDLIVAGPEVGEATRAALAGLGCPLLQLSR